IYVLVPQMRRASVSIMANIVEGYVKKSTKEFARFLDISIGSVSELEVFFELSFDLKYISKSDFIKTTELILEVKKLLYSYQKTLRAKVKN
ncbi:four helix bundle protein, partial [Patescibacteria group bacterium]|nr:four helix bundle protein [Patescibacteria group bacterium]